MAGAKRGNPNWVKGGASPNPHGRSPENAEFRALAREKSTRALERLEEWVESADGQASVKACIAIIEHGHGKAPATLHIKTTAKLRGMSIDDIRRRRAEIAAELEGRTNGEPRKPH